MAGHLAISCATGQQFALPMTMMFFMETLWGEGGIEKPMDAGESDTRGFMEPVKMVNVVNRTQCGQLPDPYDPTPIEQGMRVWYTDLTYGQNKFCHCQRPDF